jgi:hypothetical protein
MTVKPGIYCKECDCKLFTDKPGTPGNWAKNDYSSGYYICKDCRRKGRTSKRGQFIYDAF